MRWFWIDRFTSFVRGSHASAIKNVTLAEPALDDYIPGFPHYSHALMIEGAAQTGGLLVSEMLQFEKRVVLAKISKAVFHRLSLPGDQLLITTKLEKMQGDGAIVQATIDCQGQRQADLDIWFAMLDERFGDGPMFSPEYLLQWLRILGIYEVAVDAEGRRLTPPDALLEAEKRAMQSAAKSR
jgi:3-hydroxyacyl-[acyl-carrier-protein] dehydratase